MYMVRSQPSPIGTALKTVSKFVELDEAALDIKLNIPVDGQTPRRETERLKHIWDLLQQLMQDPELKKQAMATLRKLQEKRQPVVPEISLKVLPVRDRLGQAQAAMPGLTLELAISLQSQLFHQYSQPEFQASLFSIYCGNPRSLEYSKKLTTLLSSVRQDIFPQYGFQPGEEGDRAVALALSEFWTHPDMQALTKSIDELLYTAEAPMVQDSKSLTKRQVLGLLRMQMASFRKASFQDKLRYLKAAGMTSFDDDCYKLEGRARLALTEQRAILTEYGLEPSERGVHALLQQFAPYIMDPEVANYAAAVNTLLGMEERACSKFTQKLRSISIEDPGPSVGKKKMVVPPVPHRRHSVGMAGPFVHEPDASFPPGMGRRRSVGGEPMLPPESFRRRRSIATTAPQGPALARPAPSATGQNHMEANRRQSRRRSI